MVTIVRPWLPQINNGFATLYSFTMVFVVKLWLQMVINPPKKHGYYTFTIGHG